MQVSFLIRADVGEIFDTGAAESLVGTTTRLDGVQVPIISARRLFDRQSIEVIVEVPEDPPSVRRLKWSPGDAPIATR
jgi:hypothetical protein